ncbi:hypothetical protein OUZ56_028186 [Daphnia magna]|uniref:Fe2OG dioxygenase domain-containing protein n=1 Tax=Daphnia magna TaxID=35525 RepID=A0ABR0B339_9CRUS|nr:hypothetical protein OUZ56_028186 [Daphnia magna]
MSGKPRPCGCKGYRSCLLCERELNLLPFKDDIFTADSLKKQGIPSYIYCPLCNLAWPGWDYDPTEHPNHSGEAIAFPGIYIQSEFFTEKEMTELMNSFDSIPWESSVSGRRKQNFGPKTNFKKRKLQLGSFKGVPSFSRLFHERIQSVPLLKDYHTIEQCSLEYDPGRGASIEPHIDDCWVWGERIVTLNLAGDSFLTMTKYHGGDDKYNLQQVDVELPKAEDIPDICVRIPQPARSLVVIYGSARYQWLHCVLRRDIKERRVCIALREFTKQFLDPNDSMGQAILKTASNYFDCDKQC